jgi:hypothetical protein
MSVYEQKPQGGNGGYGSGYKSRTRIPEPVSREDEEAIERINRMARELAQRPPLIKPSRMPDELLGEHYEVIKEILRNYARSKAEWDDYAKKIDPSVRIEMARRFEECRENGFYGPHIGGDGESTLRS